MYDVFADYLRIEVGPDPRVEQFPGGKNVLEKGKKYYIIAHAYHHYIGEVMEVNPAKVTLKNCIKVHSCSRNWTMFFKDGVGNDTSYDVMPDGTEQPYDLGTFPWKHQIPTERNQR